MILSRSSTVLVAALGACGTDSAITNSVTSDVLVQIAAVEEHEPPTRGAAVSFAVTNLSDASVWFARCGRQLATEVERRLDGAWSNASAAICPTSLEMSPVELLPGETLTGLRGVSDAGEYRLRFGTAEGAPRTFAWTLTSPSFVVR